MEQDKGIIGALTKKSQNLFELSSKINGMNAFEIRAELMNLELNRKVRQHYVLTKDKDLGNPLNTRWSLNGE